MKIFVDTSAIIGFMVAEDSVHKQAKTIWNRLLDEGAALVTSNYIVVETVALLQKRFGSHVARLFSKNMIDEFEMLWVDEPLHQAAMAEWEGADASKISLVDHSSFLLMRRHAVRHAFSFDKHFRQQGFNILT